MIVNEIFYSLQGEGKLAGVGSVFIRLAGCPLRCRWCDTKYAWDADAGDILTPEQILEKTKAYPAQFVVVTGGEPMVQQGNKQLNEKRIHPCHKPRLLYRRLINDYGFCGMNILDTHVGGGSIRIEADLARCSFVGFEIDKEYFDKQERRYIDFKSQLRLF